MTDTRPPSRPPRQPTPHFVNATPWDPYVSEKLTADQEKYYMAGQWKLMWWRFRRHRPAVVSAIFLRLMYFSTFISELIAPYDLHTRHVKLHLRAAAGASTCSTRAASSARSSTAQMERDPRHAAARLHRRSQPSRSRCASSAAARATSSGACPRLVPFRLPGRGRHAVPVGHRPAGPRHVQPHRLRRAHLAHHRPDRHRAVVHPRP